MLSTVFLEYLGQGGKLSHSHSHGTLSCLVSGPHELYITAQGRVDVDCKSFLDITYQYGVASDGQEFVAGDLLGNRALDN